ncbi:MAG: aspartate aminotransferase family protein [Deltaproteobacteria bacterium]|jgi:predicted acetylornithine/succinylornithine family transaminase|nr:aspartate aminotransferase family protein [Deltaproteobacteria bacterium]
MALTTKQIIELGEKHLLNNVNRQPLALVRGEGLSVWDAEGKLYLDFIAGIATCAFGHCPPFASKVLTEQSQKLWHVSNLFWNEPIVELAAILTKASGLDRAFFSNSGAEANETAIKMARKHSFDRFGPDRHKIITALNSFHGRTMGAISATGQEKLHHGFAPMLPGFVFVPFGDVAALKSAIDEKTCAVMLEPVQGEGGVLTPPPGYFAQVQELCREKEALLIFDEIQTGLGRTGKDFAFRHFDVKPDILTLGKALGCGYPVGATLATESAAKALTPGSHSTTLGGAPLAMALGIELAKKILDPSFLENVQSVSRFFIGRLSDIQSERPKLVAQVRGLGLMLALVLNSPAGPVSDALRAKGFLVNATASTVLRFVPPLIVNENEINLLCRAIIEALDEVYPDGK